MTHDHATADTATTPLVVASLTDTIQQSDTQLRSGETVATVWPTGFTPLDQHLTGGFRGGDLVLLAGVQGLGKTTFALQVARNVALTGQHVLFVCYEHSRQQLAERLLVLEAGLKGGGTAPTLQEARWALDIAGEGGYRERLAEHPQISLALDQLALYGDRLHLMSARADSTTLDDVKAAIEAVGEPCLVVLDYLQKVTLGIDVDEEVRVARVATRLKDMALDLAVPVMAIAAVERADKDAHRARVKDLKGSVTVAYEADVILILNEKYDIVARHHLMYDTTGAERYRDWMVCSIEKNRSGESHLDLEFVKRFSRAHYDPHGRMVAEKLVDERVHVE